MRWYFVLRHPFACGSGRLSTDIWLMTDKPTAAKEPPWGWGKKIAYLAAYPGWGPTVQAMAVQGTNPMEPPPERIDAAKVEELYFPDAPTPIAAKVRLLRLFEKSLAKVKEKK